MKILNYDVEKIYIIILGHLRIHNFILSYNLIYVNTSHIINYVIAHIIIDKKQDFNVYLMD